MPALTTIELGGPVEPWVALGLTIVDDDRPTITIGSVTLRFDGSAPGGINAPGISALGIDDLAEPVVLDGLSFGAVAAGERGPAHPCGASLIDHIVVMTSSLERTCGAVEAGLGAPLKRIREVAPGVRQGFHRLGEVILEVVETPQVTEPSAAFWGLVIVVDDLDGWAAELGADATSPAKTAVQPGRRISNVRREFGLPLPVAFMSPDPRAR